LKKDCGIQNHEENRYLFLMKYKAINSIFWLSFFLFTSCGNNESKSPLADHKYSTTQNYLFQIIENYKTDYFAASDAKQRADIRTKYQDKMEHFLVDSLGRYIDSMTVIVDTVIQKGWLVTTQFHTKDIEFKYGLMFQNNMPSSVDSLYKFMISLSPGEKIVVDFAHLGSGELNYPDDTSNKIMRIFAYPQPIKTIKKQK
jgi:hypothetical protein